MLASVGLISAADAEVIAKGLDQVAGEFERGEREMDAAKEDVHMNVESRLIELVGEPARRLHTARSRNDQVATDLRLFARRAAIDLVAGIDLTRLALARRAREHADTLLPGYTHLQRAQVVTLGHHLLAYAEMLRRDRGRLVDAVKRAGQSPLGSGALAATGLPIDRAHTAKALGFDEPTHNSLDAVSDRDFAAEFLFATALLGVHLSRIGEEIILWVTPEFGWARLDDAWSTGSSIMPQKKNPDIAELARGKSGRFIGNLTGLLATLKGLPLAYDRDLQEDKEPVFDTVDQLLTLLPAVTGLVATLTFDTHRLTAAAPAGFALATDVAEWLVRQGVAFREAHEISGAFVSYCEQHGVDLHALTDTQLREIDERLTPEVQSVLSVPGALRARSAVGGTSPERVAQQARDLTELVHAQAAWAGE
jgi:argininosuccinate lyase